MALGFETGKAARDGTTGFWCESTARSLSVTGCGNGCVLMAELDNDDEPQEGNHSGARAIDIVLAGDHTDWETPVVTQ
jgi:hypothetical protein